MPVRLYQRDDVQEDRKQRGRVKHQRRCWVLVLIWGSVISLSSELFTNLSSLVNDSWDGSEDSEDWWFDGRKGLRHSLHATFSVTNVLFKYQKSSAAGSSEQLEAEFLIRNWVKILGKNYIWKVWVFKLLTFAPDWIIVVLTSCSGFPTSFWNACNRNTHLLT